MTKTLLRAGALSCALMATTCLTSPAFAQSEQRVIDENGIDLLTGYVRMSEADLSIGPAANPLELRRTINGDIDQITHDWLITISQSNGGASLNVNTRGLSKTFNFDLTGHPIDVEQAGEQLTLNTGSSNPEERTLFTDRNGTRTYFYDLGNGSYYGTRVAYPNGYEARLYWGYVQFCEYDQGDIDGDGDYNELVNCVWAGRLHSVADNRGYQLRFSYLSDLPSAPTHFDNYYDWSRLTSVTALNNAVETCAPETSCTLSGSWPTVTYQRGQSGNDPVLTVTQPEGRVWRYRGSQSQTNTSSGPRYTGSFFIQRPDSSAENYEVRYTSGALQSGDHELSVFQGLQTDHYDFASSTVSTNLTSSTITRTSATGAVSSYEAYHYRVPVSPPYVYGEFTRLHRRTDGLGNVWRFNHDASTGQLISARAPEGNEEVYFYDSRGNVTTVTRRDKAGSGSTEITTSASFPSSCSNIVVCNQPTSTTDARGNVTDYTYDATHGGVLTVTAPAPTSGAVRPQTRHAYTSLQAYYRNGSGSVVASGRPIYLRTSTSTCMTQTPSSCVGTSDEARTTIDYGPQTSGVANNLAPITTTVAAGDGSISAPTTSTYDTIGNIVSVDGALAGATDTTRYRYDNARRVIGDVGPDPDGSGSLPHRAIRNTYDASDRITRADRGTVTDQSDSAWAAMTASETVETQYDSNGNRVRETLSGGGTAQAVTQYSYDADNRLVCTAVRMNPAVFSSLPSSACIVGTPGAQGPDRITHQSYDAANRVTQVQTGYGTSEQAVEVATTYTANGRQATVIDGEGNRTSYVYDGHDRLSRTHYPSPTQGAGTSSATDYEELSYDADDNVTSRRLRDTTSIGYTYDALNRLTFKDTPNAVYADPDVTYVYDLLGRTTAVTSANGLNFAAGYDALGRQTSETSYFGTKTMQYDPAGRITRLTWPDSFYVDYDHLVTGEVSAVRENGATSGIGVLATYSYDALGRRTGITRGNGTSTSYSYDAVSRLTSLAHDLNGTSSDLTLSFTHNPAAQLVSATRSNDNYAYTARSTGSIGNTINGLNQQTAVGGLSLSHDSRGNISAIGGTGFSYTSENRLSHTGSAVLIYDAAGRLLLTTDGTTETRLDMLGNEQLITELNASNAILRRYVHGAGIDEPLVWYEGSGTSDRRWLHADERGSILAVSDASGNLVGTRNRYDDYGEAQGTLTGRFGYTGQPWLSEANLYHYRARAFHPGLGRFMQTDPVGYAGGINVYAYVADDPINITDPRGLDCGPEMFSGVECVVTGRRPSRSSDTPREFQWADIRDYYREMFLRLDRIALILRDFSDRDIPDRGPFGPFEDAIGPLLRGLRSRFCEIPPIALTLGMDAYSGPGGGAAAGASFDIRNGQFRGIWSSSVGVGYGGGFGLNLGAGNVSGNAITTDLTVSYEAAAVTVSSPGVTALPSLDNVSGGVSVSPRFGPNHGVWRSNSITHTTNPTRMLYNAC